jgi:hypothetical protein
MIKIQKSPLGHWKDVANQRKFIDKLALKLNIKTPDDWYSITNKTLFANGASGVLRRHKDSIPNMLQTLYPEYPKRKRTKIIPLEQNGKYIALIKCQKAIGMTCPINAVFLTPLP